MVSQADVVVLEADGLVGQANTVQREAGGVVRPDCVGVWEEMAEG
ncbi:hypothetical protein ACIHFD_39925 [Nonomuraea sp. NPDC051941]